MNASSSSVPGRGNMAAASWELRGARPADADACAALAVGAWRRIHDAYIAILGPDVHHRAFSGWEEAKARDVYQVVQAHPERALVVAAGDALIGFVTFHLDPLRKIGSIGNNAIDPAWQGRGIGTAMYRAVLERFRAEGMELARVSTGLDEGHAPARAAYEKAGFRQGLPSITYYQELRPATTGQDGPASER